ncbi:hypothetical protein CN680_15875 [Bacillus pseudomycoides]|uniref:DUF4018 domain-containing protein n=1 Tax=Bacillus pseudomycoides TaxID=64104 RepID=UPI000BED8D70|nr:DUF4018 domain-containing protein [Bacillus pseudomycoides]PED71536.1 hypothetical protein CON97_13635 [Bacillus pseudomycoides]PEI47174.1 hypothetical protein CN620_00060 [Bacillus pseudomycoides]PEJ77187.1 hypothetical protein CN680_15875 [Bacillus pseudomycoides]PEM10197.1 hypothetical protein CN628_22745 [Bacillus pseudomycoides]PEP00385.1 hypothetical protein CN550_10605 [Bacillus pseudomycoides]
MKTWLHYVNDVLLLLLLSLLTEQGRTIPIILFLVISFLCTILIHKMKTNKRRGFILLFILQVILCYVFSIFSIVSSILLPFFFYIVHARDDLTAYHKMLGAFLWFIVSYFLHLMKLPSLWVLGLFALFILLSLWITSYNKDQKAIRFVSITGIGTISFLFFLFIPYIRIVLSYLFYWLSLGFGYGIEALLSITNPNDAIAAIEKLGGTSPELPEPDHPYDAFVAQAVTASIIGIIAAFVIWKLYKKRKSFYLENISFYNSGTVMQEEGILQKATRMTRPPTNAIRKEIFKLEKKLKPPLNRNRGETVDAWMERIQTEEDISIEIDTIIKAYNTVRYANQEYTELFREFKEEVNKLYAYQKTLKKKKK